jgi:hypothetical protein
VSYDISNRLVNHRLVYWQQRAGFNNTRLAAAIRERARKHGYRQIQPDARRVRAWRHGERPRDPVPDLMLEVFHERVGTSLTLADIGLGQAETERFPRDGPLLLIQTINDLISTSRCDLMLRRDDHDLRPRDFLIGPDLLGMVQSWTTTAAASATTGMNRGQRKIGDQDIMQIRAVTDAFRKLDNAYGGGLTREAVIGQLLSTASLMQDATYTEETGRKLLIEIGDLATVAGWMSHDVSMHAVAQRYFLLALQAAREAEVPNLGAHVLSCMARQAGHLGRPQDALELIHLARYGTRHTATPTIAALLYGLEARYCAKMGRLRDFDRAAGCAEAAFAEQGSGEDPAWVAYFDISEYYATLGICHQIAARHVARGQAGRAIEMIGLAVAHRDPARTRSRVFDHLGLAQAHLAGGDLEAAAAAGTTALELAGRMSSARVQDRLYELFRETGPHSRVSVIAELRGRILEQGASR